MILGVLWERARVCTVEIGCLWWIDRTIRQILTNVAFCNVYKLSQKRHVFTDFKDSQPTVTFSTWIQFRDQKMFSRIFFFFFSKVTVYFAPIFHGISFSYLSLCLYFFLVQFLRINNKTQATQIHRTYNKKLLVTIVLQSHYHIILLPYVFLSCIWCMLIVGYMYMLWFDLILISIQILFS